MRPLPDVAPVCANCRFLEEHPSSEERSRLRAWCQVWRLLIPDPAHTGCPKFEPKATPTEEPSTS
jgi:hypothetical protein